MYYDFFLILILIIFFTFLYTAIGCSLISEKKFNQILIINPIILGFSIYLILLFIFYFFLKFTLTNSFLITVFIFLSISFLFYKKNYNYINKIFLKNIIIIIPSVIFFLILSLLYQDNFFVFRGNHWDYFYYLSQSILTHKYTYPELLSLNEKNLIILGSKDFIPFYFNNSFDKIFFHNERSLIFLIYGILFIFPIKNIFFVSFIFKIFIASLAGCSLFLFLKTFIKNNLSYLLSIIFTYSFWIIYIHETEALPNSASICLFITLVFSLVIFENKPNKFYPFVIYIVCALFSALYLLYFELFLLITLLYLFFLFLNFKLYKNLFLQNKKTFLINFSFFLFVVLISHQNLLIPIMIRLFERVGNTNAYAYDSIKLWGYFGSFILGKESIFFNTDIVNQLINTKILNNFLLIKNIAKLNFENGYNFFYLNIIPSITGLYHLGVLKNDHYFFYPSLFFCILINFYLFFISIKNFKNLFFYKKKWFYFFIKIIIFFLILSLYFFYNGNFYFILKLYFALSFVIFIYFSINFSNKNKINLLFLVLILCFPIYKFSINNYGISKKDTFPSIINDSYKKNFEWKIESNNIKNCSNYINLISDFETNKLQWIKYNFINIRTYRQENYEKLSFKCLINDSSSQFYLTKN